MKKIIIPFIIFVVLAGAIVWFINHKSSTPAVSQTGGTPYTSETFGFDVVVPPGFRVDESYLNQTLGPGREIPGVAFRIPESLAAGTNLSADSAVVIEELSDVDCVASDFLNTTSEGTQVTLGGKSYTFAQSSDAGAGNFYDESVYITKKQDSCYAIRYFTHSTNIQNYDPGSVTEFDKAGLKKSFDAFASTLDIH